MSAVVPCNGPPTVSARGEGWIEVGRRFPLWDSIPADFRVTEQMIRARITRVATLRFLAYQEGEVQRLDHPACSVAVVQTIYNGRWAPCAQAVRVGADLCRQHGGPPVRDTQTARSVLALEAENAALRAELDRRAELLS